MKTLKTLLRNSQWHNKISIETQEVSLRIRSGTFLVKGLEDFDERNLKIYAEKHISNICENWNREMRKEDSHAGTTYICAQSCGVYIAWR